MSRRSLVWVRALVFIIVIAGWLLPMLGDGGARAAADAPKGAGKSAAELLPANTLFYAEVSRPKDLIALVLDNPAVVGLLNSPQYREKLETPQFKGFMDALALVEARAGVKWRPALETMTGGGIVIAIEPSTQGGIAFVRSEDPKTTAAVREALFALAAEDAANKGKPDPVQRTQYRELVAHKAGENTLLECGPWLLATNKPDLAKRVADAYLDGPAEGDSLARSDEFVAARALAPAASAKAIGADATGGDAAAQVKPAAAEAQPAAGKGSPAAWAFVRLPPLRLLALDQPWMKPNAKSDNPGAELIFGGLVGVIQRAPFATVALDASADGLKLSVAAPNDTAWVPEERKFYFSPPGEGGEVSGGAAPALKPKNTVFSLTTYRDLAGMWQAGPDLFTEAVAAQMAKSDSQLSTFLGGKSFGTDLLGALKPQVQFVAAAQDYAKAGVAAPAIRIPAMASVFRLKPAEAKAAGVRKHMRVAFQSLIAIGNLDGAAKNRPMLDLQSEKRGDAEIHWAVYDQPEGGADAAGDEGEAGDAAKRQAPAVAPADGGAGPAGADAAAAEGNAKPGADAPAEEEAKPEGAPAPTPAASAETRDDIHYNFSPALVISPDYLMLCSTREIAQELAELAAAEKKAGKTAATLSDNTLIEMDSQAAAALLRDNREQLIAQNMLEKGNDRAAAEQEIDFFVDLVNAFRGVSFRLTPTDKTVALELELKMGK